jgi:ABC-2 type transport system ATP-binding protein
LLTTHYLEEADSLSDRVIVIDRGKVVAQGTPAELKQANTGRRIKCVTRLPVHSIREMIGVRTVRQHGVVIDIISDRPEQTVRELLAMDENLSGLEVVSQALDDAFLSLVHNGEPVEVLQ